MPPGFGSKKAEVHPLDEGRLEVKLPTEDPAKVQQASDAISRLDFQNLGITVRFISSSSSNGSTTLIYQADHRADAVDMNKLINAVVKRVNPGGQREVAIRRVGSDQIEVAIPDVDKAEIEQIKEKIATAGALEFRIVADRRLPEHEEAIEAAKAEIKNPSNEVSNGRKIVAQWVDLGKDEPPNPTWLTREIKGKTQVLVIRDDYNVTGAYLTNARMGYGDKGDRGRVSASIPRAPGDSANSPGRTWPIRPTASSTSWRSSSTIRSCRRRALKAGSATAGESAAASPKSESIRSSMC